LLIRENCVPGRLHYSMALCMKVSSTLMHRS